MAFAIQLDLFEKNDDISVIYRQLEKTTNDQDKLRRSIFARHGDLLKLYALQQEEIMQLKRFLIDNHGAKLMDFPPKTQDKKKKNKKVIDFT